MKRIALIFLLLAGLLAGCGQRATPTVTDADMATKVAQILTNMPTATGQAPKAATATPLPPTTAATASPKAPEATKPPASTAGVTPTLAATQPAASASATPVPPTATKAVTASTSATPAVTKTQAASTPTLVAGDPRARLGAPTWVDKMNDGGNWPTGADPAGYTEVAFQDGFMLFSALKPVDGWRLTLDRLSNVYLEMTVNSGECLPKDRYGVIVRVPVASEANRGYLFGFSCDGKYAIRKWDGEANNMNTLVNWKTNAAIQAGANKSNRLGLAMDGSKMALYANGVLLDTVQDATWREGHFGIFAGAHESSKFTLKVDEIGTWPLP